MVLPIATRGSHSPREVVRPPARQPRRPLLKRPSAAIVVLAPLTEEADERRETKASEAGDPPGGALCLRAFARVQRAPGNSGRVPHDLRGLPAAGTGACGPPLGGDSGGRRRRARRDDGGLLRGDGPLRRAEAQGRAPLCPPGAEGRRPQVLVEVGPGPQGLEEARPAAKSASALHRGAGPHPRQAARERLLRGGAGPLSLSTRISARPRRSASWPGPPGIWSLRLVRSPPGALPCIPTRGGTPRRRRSSTRHSW